MASRDSKAAAKKNHGHKYEKDLCITLCDYAGLSSRLAKTGIHFEQARSYVNNF